jgi:hypothetical protein
MTTIITGRDITFTIDGDDFDAQATSATLTVDSTINTFQTLDGKAYFTTDSQGSFAVEMLADWGAASSLVRSSLDSGFNLHQTPHCLLYWLRIRAHHLRLMFSQYLAICRRHSTRCTNCFTIVHLCNRPSFNN